MERWVVGKMDRQMDRWIDKIKRHTDRKIDREMGR